MNYGIALMSEWKRILEIEQRSMFNVTKSLGTVCCILKYILKVKILT